MTMNFQPKIVSWVVLAFTVFATNVMSQTGSMPERNEEAVLRRLEDEWLSCYVSGDKLKYNHLVAEDFVGTDESGVVRSKAKDAALLPAAPVPGAIAANENVTVDVYGNFAIVRGLIVTKAILDGKEVANFRTRFTDTWINRKKNWSVLARHYSRVPIDRVAIDLPEAVLAEYQGKYEIGPGAEVTVSTQGRKLVAQFPGPTKLELMAESEIVFFSKEIPALYIFVRDRSGHINGMLIIQDGKITFAKGPVTSRPEPNKK
jgi:hypothetical protein